MSKERRFGALEQEEQHIIVRCLEEVVACRYVAEDNLPMATLLRRLTTRSEFARLLAVLNEDYELSDDDLRIMISAVAVVAFNEAFPDTDIPKLTGVKPRYLLWFFYYLKDHLAAMQEFFPEESGS